MSEITHLKAEETKITDYERGVEQASTIYKGVIRGYKAENTKLREQGARLFDKTLELGTENDKLRELVRDMWHEGAFEPGAYCVPEAYGLAERTRELGIEVDGWLS